MELQQLKHFIAAVDARKLLTAAQACEISQSGMSRSLGTLEESLGVRLLKRTAGGVEPTIYGQFLLPGARMIVSQVERCSREIMALKSAANNELSFGVTDNIGRIIIPILLDVASNEFPDITIHVQTGNLPKLMDGLQSGAVDCVVALMGRVEEHPDLVFDQNVRHQPKVVARFDHPLALERTPISPAALSQARWATLNGDGFQNDFENFFLSMQLPVPSQIMKTDSLGLIVEALASTDLITALPPEFICSGMRQHKLVLLECNGPNINMQTTMATRRAHFMVEKQLDLINRVRRLGVPWLQVETGDTHFGTQGKVSAIP